MREHRKTSDLAVAEVCDALAGPSPVIVPANTSELTYAKMLKRHWRLGAAMAIAVFALTVVSIFRMPKTYLADVLVVLQQPARLAASGTNSSVVQPELRQKLETLREQVLSRRTLGEVAQKLGLAGGNQPAGDKVIEQMRQAITLKLDKSTFRLSYEHVKPEMAAAAANELASRYIEENMRASRKMLSDTSQFIVSQLKILDKQVKESEQVLQDFRKENIGAMPEDVPANQAMLMALSTQVTQAETSLEGEKTRKQQIEGRLAEMLVVESAQRQRTIRKLARALNQFPQLGEDAAREIQKQVDEVLARLPSKWAGLQELRGANPGNEIRARTANTMADSPSGGNPDADEPEIQLLKEQLRIREIAVRDAEQNMKSLEQLRLRGMLADAAFNKGQNDLERIRGELRMQRAQGLLTRNDYLDRLKVAVLELAGLVEFQGIWVEALARIQECDSQQFRSADGSADSREAARPVDGALKAFEKLRQSQGEGSAIFNARGDLAVLVQEHENIVSGLFRRRAETRQSKSRMEELDRRLSNSSKVQVELPELMRRYKTVTDQYDNMLRYKMESDLAMGVEDQQEGGRMMIWDAAVAPSAPYRPKYVSLIAIAMACSTALGAGLALLLGSYESHVMATKFLNAEDLHACTGVDVLAGIHFAPPRAVGGPGRDGGGPDGKGGLSLFAMDPRVNRDVLDCCSMLFRPQKRCPQILAVCSAANGDGKSFVASHLAVALAGTVGEDVILIDANMRNPGIHSAFELPLENGLGEALDGLATRPVFHTMLAQPRLKILTAGCVNGHSAMLLGGRTFRELLGAIRRKYENSRVLIDVPSFQTGSDAELLIDAVDGVLLVVRRDFTPIHEVMQSLRKIPRNKMMGLIFNSLPRIDASDSIWVKK